MALKNKSANQKIKTKDAVSKKPIKKKADQKKVGKKAVGKPAERKPARKKTLKKPAVKKSAQKKNTKKKSIKKTSKKKPAVQKSVSAKPKSKKTIRTPLSKPADKKKPALSYLNELEQELERILEKNKQVAIKSSEGFEYCFAENCDQPSTTGGYCRYHYMVSWDYIKERNKILSGGRLKSWITEIIQGCSPRVLDYMVRDLSNEKDFSAALGEMKLAPKKNISY